MLERKQEEKKTAKRTDLNKAGLEELQGPKSQTKITNPSLSEEMQSRSSCPLRTCPALANDYHQTQKESD